MHYSIIIFLLSTFGFLPNYIVSQDTLFFEDFENPNANFTLNSTDLNSVGNGFNFWTINNVYQGGNGSIICLGFPFSFSVPSTPTQPAGIENAPMSTYLHIISDAASQSGVYCSSFIAADGLCILDQNYFAKMSSDINTTGLSAVQLSFWWMNASPSDIIGEVHYSTDGGSTWIPVPGAGSLGGQNYWSQSTFSDPAFENQTTLRFGFRFVNATSFNAVDPPFSIDDIVITAEEECADIFLILETDLCEGDSVFAGGAYQTNGGTFTDIYESQGGCDSTVVNTVALFPIVSYIIGDSFFCEGDTVLFHGIYISESYVFTEILTYTNGCDSAIFEDYAEFISVDTTVVQIGDTLFAQEFVYSSFQWIDCNTGEEIPGATENMFIPESSGLYAVYVDNFLCSDTSSCFEVLITSIPEYFEFSIDIFPNPVQNELNIRSANRIKSYELYDNSGRLIGSNYASNQCSVSIPTSNISSGTYLITIAFENGCRHRELLVKY